MAKEGSSPSLPEYESKKGEEQGGSSDFGANSGWIEARTKCDHLDSLSTDLLHIPVPSSPCIRCEDIKENWLCLCCKHVFCSRYVNKHMVQHFQQQNHCLALSYSDLSVWCFLCDGYLDAQRILPLRPAYETAYLLKFQEAPAYPNMQEQGEPSSS